MNAGLLRLLRRRAHRPPGNKEAGLRRLPFVCQRAGGSAAILRSSRVLSGFLNRFPGPLHVLACAADGVAGSEGSGGEHGQQQQCDRTFHVTPHRLLDATNETPSRREASAKHGPRHGTPATGIQLSALRRQSRISVDLPNRLSTSSTASSAVTLRSSRGGLTSTMSSDAMRPVSAIISITSCASR